MRVRHPARVLTEEFDDGLVIYLLGSRTLHHLDPAASEIWRALAHKSVESLLGDAVAAFPQHRDRVRSDLLALVDQLVAVQLLEPVQ